jgi:hypothetical protein
MLAFKNNSLSLETYLVLRYALFTYLAHMSSKRSVGRLITKTIIEMAQGHISLSITSSHTHISQVDKFTKNTSSQSQYNKFTKI